MDSCDAGWNRMVESRSCACRERLRFLRRRGRLAETGKYDAIICLGCLLRGDTAHYDVIVNEVTRGIGQSAQETGVPHAFGVLTCDTLEQAIDRAGLKMGNKGFEAALAAVEMARLKKALRLQLSAVSGKQVPRSARNDKVRSRNDKAGSKTLTKCVVRIRSKTQSNLPLRVN